MNMPFYNELVAATEAERQAFLQIPAVMQGLQGDIPRSSYIAFLTQAYYHVRHTVPLLMACGAALPQDKEWLRVAIGEYIEEEMGHQEWILNDIEAAGGDRERVRTGIPDFSTEMMVSYAYDTIQRNNPVGFFGMVLVLEGSSVALASSAAGVIREKLDLPEAAFSYLSSHGSLDQEHIRFFESLMNRLESSEDKQAVLHAASRFYQLYGNIFRSLPLNENTQRVAA
jgi:thiaminase